MIFIWGNSTGIYFPSHAGVYGNDSVLVRMKDGSAKSRERLEAVLGEISPSVADMINPMEDVLAPQIYPFRVTGWVAGFLAGVELLLTVAGIYGVMSFLVSQRTKEIGIRVALGAGRADILGMVVRQSTWLAAIGAGAAWRWLWRRCSRTRSRRSSRMNGRHTQ